MESSRKHLDIFLRECTLLLLHKTRLLSCPIKNRFLQDTVFEETFWLPLIDFDINVKYIG